MSSRDRPVTLLIFPHQLFEDHPGLLMLVAIALHFKIRDALVKSLPAIAMLVLCLSILGMSMLRG